MRRRQHQLLGFLLQIGLDRVSGSLFFFWEPVPSAGVWIFRRVWVLALLVPRVLSEPPRPVALAEEGRTIFEPVEDFPVPQAVPTSRLTPT